MRKLLSVSVGRAVASMCLLASVAFIVSSFAKVSTTQELSSPLISTAKYWEARLSSVQYAEISKQEGSRSHIILKGNVPSSALALVVTCTALDDMQFATKEFWAVSDVPTVTPARGGMSGDVVVEVVTTATSAVRFEEMMVFHKYGGSTVVDLSALTAKKGQTINVLFAYELPQDLRKTPNDLSPLTIHADQMTQDLKVPILWRSPAIGR